jgi:hypothetical protein
MKRFLLALMLVLSACHPVYAAEDIADWSLIAADNDNADTAIDWTEGMAPSAVNNSARSMMVANKKFYDAIADGSFWSARNFIVDTNTLFADTTNNRVGVGTASPDIPLHTSKSDSAVPSYNVDTLASFENNSGAANVSILSANTSYSGLWFGDSDAQAQGRIRYDHTADELEFWTGGSSKATLDLGMVIGSATGGDQGSGTVNATGVYVNGVAVGTGSGDLLSTNNLSDVSNAATARANLGLLALATLNSVGASQIDANAVAASEIAANAVGASELADNGVGLADMAHSTSGAMLYYSGGAPASLAAGSANQVLTMSGGNPSWQTAGGGWTKHGTVYISVTSSTSLTWTAIPATAEHIRILVQDSSGNAEELSMRLGDSGGYETTGYSGRVRDGSAGDNWGSQALLTRGTGSLDFTNGHINLTNITSNTWLIEGQSVTEGGGFGVFEGVKSTSGTFDRIEIRLDAGGTIDAGNYVLYYQ